jgi:hypothetical protein
MRAVPESVTLGPSQGRRMRDCRLLQGSHPVTPARTGLRPFGLRRGVRLALSSSGPGIETRAVYESSMRFVIRTVIFANC